MRQLKKLKITESIESEKLIFEENWYDRFDTWTIYFASLAMIGSSVLCVREIKPSLNNGLEYLFFTVIFTFSLYVFYCKSTEKYLKEIKFSISKDEAKNRILEYGKKYNYRITKVSTNLFYLNETADFYSPVNYEQTTIIFFKNNAILYTVIKECSRANFPVLFSKYLTIFDLKKILHQKEAQPRKRSTYFSSFFHGL
ncbi:hypothetical protein C1637_19055 [Chryseobacterium lactis]|uniref:YcxB family protein n=1 Tax=Chryseobacterium lactis TaxID=1241981 RepID=A0A3G6RPV6_CHRLC|nr:hypothetical protein [Chryseobacterium lactis]AZA84881.1 hypothetical protein EG342_24565 [Chryseobacterium lactis]AZB05269.1 hypothetical protein EG341_15445 [Chryseobacterium lactis]PNW12252.1 hypothetical protein C1637_19055 [Chryseobacterium lactis]